MYFFFKNNNVSTYINNKILCFCWIKKKKNRYTIIWFNNKKKKWNSCPLSRFNFNISFFVNFNLFNKYYFLSVNINNV